MSDTQQRSPPSSANESTSSEPQMPPATQTLTTGAEHILKRKSAEYALVMAYILAVNAVMFWIAAGASKRLRLQIVGYLGDPWLFKGYSHGIDQADFQWRDFVNNFGLLGPGLLFFAVVTRLIRPIQDGRWLPYYYAASGFLFTLYLHNAAAIFMIALQLANYFGIAKLHAVLPFKLYMALMWFAHIAVLFVNDRYDGYRFAAIHPSLSYFDSSNVVLRWHIVFNMSTLRMIAFNYDIWEARFHGAETRDKVERKHKATCVDCALISGPCYKLRTDAPHPLEQYNIITYFAYLLYIPLFIGGPMSSFNAFVSHLQRPQCSFKINDAVKYAVRIIVLFFTMEFLLHFIHLNAMRRNGSVFEMMTIPEKVTLLHSSLAFLWLKFNIIWKFFRLIALIDGVEAPEDMRRCFSNTVTVQSFWRDWHASFNAWIVRYMYVPMGGSRYRMVTIFPIFGFIALWHDITMNLFMWALVMCVAFVPEIAVTSYFYTPRFKALHAKWYWRHLRALGGTCGVTGLVMANLVGFGAGTKNTSNGFSSLVTEEAGIVGMMMIIYFYCAATIGIRDRDTEDEQLAQARVKLGLVRDREPLTGEKKVVEREQ